MVVEYMNWIAAAISLIGVFLNARGKWQGFCFWLLSNSYWCVYETLRGEYPQAALFAAYWILALYGLLRWLKHPPCPSPPTDDTGVYNIDGSKAYSTAEFFGRMRGEKGAEK